MKITNITIKFMKIRIDWRKVGTIGGKNVAQSWHLQ